jgi:SAM-dependent methyltransferase
LLVNLKKYFNSADTSSKAHQFRLKRFSFFLKLFEEILITQSIVKILDVGGWEIFWKNMGIERYPNVHILLLNLYKQPVSMKNIESMVGDGCRMDEFESGQFDIVFSNSVIEHAGDFNRQMNMANEIRRVGKNYFVQTPNYYFPIEPHFMFIGFQWLPVSVRVFLIRHFNLGWIEKIPDYNKAVKMIEDTRLLKYSELNSMFPDAKIYREKYLGFTKSFVVYKKETSD